ncbi:hypothetical protein Misp03_05660 [Microbispora sp. NBRC 16548]|nr:hypothetical protein Misp03_05660 [Microbispora sp. NBRC 16548]
MHASSDTPRPQSPARRTPTPGQPAARPASPLLPAPTMAGPWRPVRVLPAAEPRTFSGVAMRADGSAWAVGAGVDNEAWVGRFTVRGWKRVPLTGVEGAGRAVVVDQEDHLWVFTGAPDYAPDMSRSSAARWDGRSWRITDLGGGLGITRARAIGPEVWFLARKADVGQTDATVVERRRPDGRWTDTHMPIRAESIDGRTPSDVWAVGRDTATRQPAAARWNGRAWTRVALPHLPLVEGLSALFWDVLARDTRDVWAVGGVFNDTGEEQPAQWLIGHWDGREWSMDVIRDDELDGTGLTEIVDDGRHGAWIEAQWGTRLLHMDRHGRITLRQRLEDGKCEGGDVTALVSRPGTPGLRAVGTRSSCKAGGVHRATVYRAAA